MTPALVTSPAEGGKAFLNAPSQGDQETRRSLGGDAHFENRAQSASAPAPNRGAPVGGERAGLLEERRDGAPIVGLLPPSVRFEILSRANGSRSCDLEGRRWCLPGVAAIGPRGEGRGASTPARLERPS